MAKAKRLSITLNSTVEPKVKADAELYGVTMSAIINMRLTEYYRMVEGNDFITSGKMSEQLQELKKVMEEGIKDE